MDLVESLLVVTEGVQAELVQLEELLELPLLLLALEKALLQLLLLPLSVASAFGVRIRIIRVDGKASALQGRLEEDGGAVTRWGAMVIGE